MKYELTNKVIINNNWGGFTLNEKIINIIKNKLKIAIKKSDLYDIPRNSKILVNTIIDLKNNMRNLDKNTIKILNDFVIAPINMKKKYYIYNYDGMEWITEVHKIYSLDKKKWLYSTLNNKGNYVFKLINF